MSYSFIFLTINYNNARNSHSSSFQGFINCALDFFFLFKFDFDLTCFFSIIKSDLFKFKYQLNLMTISYFVYFLNFLNRNPVLKNK
jgi:hypothetical protein